VVTTVNTLVIRSGTARIVRRSVRVCNRTPICVIHRKDNVFVDRVSEERTVSILVTVLHGVSIAKTNVYVKMVPIVTL